jgi:amino acid transporter
MGKIEDIMVYTKLLILLFISGLLIKYGTPNLSGFAAQLSSDASSSNFLNIMIVASITFVAYEDFQLVINAMEEMKN